MKTAVILLVLASILTVRFGAIAQAAGSLCSHSQPCGHGEVCVADSPTSSQGHCAVIRILENR